MRRAEEARSLGIGSSGGGFAVPIEIDPTVILTSDGAVSPLRQLARVRTATSSELRLVASQGVTASFDPESTEVSDDTPTLTQPIIYPEKAQAFVEFSIELDQDARTLTQELGRLIGDAKAVLEADKYINGAGHTSTEPQGLLGSASSLDLPVGSHLGGWPSGRRRRS